MMCVYCAVRTETLNLFQCTLVFEGLNMSFIYPCFREKVCCVLIGTSMYLVGIVISYGLDGAGIESR